MQIEYASTTRKRSAADRMTAAIAMLDKFTQAQHDEARRSGREISVRNVGGESVIFRGDQPADARITGIGSAELRAARERVEAIRIAASKPLLDARAKVSLYKSLAAR